MVAYDLARHMGPRSQWDTTSGTILMSQAFNCGTTCATEIATYYRNAPGLGIEYTRTAAGVPRGRATTYDEQRRMTIERGVSCSVRVITTLSELRSLVSGGRRPVSIGVNMAYVPASYRGHSFTGMHSWLLVAAPAGYWDYYESNLPTGSSGLRRRVPDWVMQAAFINHSPRCAVVPYNAKPAPSGPAPLPSRGKIQMNQNITYVNLRSGPSLNDSIIGSARGPAGAAGAGIYRGSVKAFSLSSVFNYIGSDATGGWRKMNDYLNRIYWVKSEYTHLVT